MPSKEPTLYVRGAFGISHSVPESELEQFRKEQQNLRESGELERRLKAQAERVAKKYADGTFRPRS